MNLYYGLTNYHLLCSILHKITYLPNERAIFVASEGILKNRIKELEKIGIFDEVYYIEDKKMRDEELNKLNEKSSNLEIERIAYEFTDKYDKIIPFNIEKIKKFHIFADHGAFGLYLLIKRQKYIFFEDAKGLYSNWKNLDKALAIKDPGMRTIALYYKAYGKSELAIKKYIDYNSQTDDCNLSKCINFDINILLDKVSKENLRKIFEIFNLRKYKIDNTMKIALVLTQRFSTYKLLTR